MRLSLKKLGVIVLTTAVLAGIVPTMNTNQVQAATKKISVKKVYTTTTKVKGKIGEKYQARIKLGKKTYKAKASKKGNFSVKIPKQKVGKSFYVKVYRKKGKKYKYVAKKKVYVLTKSLSVKSFKTQDRYIKGYVYPKYKVKVTVNGKSYTKTASKTKGYFSIKTRSTIGSSNVYVKVYNTKKKLVKKSTKKATNARKTTNSNSNNNSNNNNNSNQNKNDAAKEEAEKKASCGKGGHWSDHVHRMGSHSVLLKYGADMHLNYQEYIDNIDIQLAKYPNDDLFTLADFRAATCKWDKEKQQMILYYYAVSNYDNMPIYYCDWCDEYYMGWDTRVKSWEFPYQLKDYGDGTYHNYALILPKSQGQLTTEQLYEKYKAACKRYNRTIKPLDYFR